MAVSDFKLNLVSTVANRSLDEFHCAVTDRLTDRHIHTPKTTRWRSTRSPISLIPEHPFALRPFVQSSTFHSSFVRSFVQLTDERRNVCSERIGSAGTPTL